LCGNNIIYKEKGSFNKNFLYFKLLSLIWNLSLTQKVEIIGRIRIENARQAEARASALASAFLK